MLFRLLEESHRLALTDDLQFHVLELPKFTKSAAELTSRLDIWLYFSRHAEKMDTEALPAALQQPLVMRALEELTMLAQSDQERERYEARRKAQLDENTLVKVARQEGRQEGEQIGIVHLCERLLGRPVTPREQLAAMGFEALTRLAQELQALVVKRG